MTLSTHTVRPTGGLPLALSLTLAATLAFSGCARFSPDGGFHTVAELTQERTGQPTRWQRSPADVDTAQARMAELLAQPLTAESAVELALLNHPGLQARYAELGVEEAERVRAGRLRNPSLRLGRLSDGQGAVEIERSVTVDLLGLLTLPLNDRLGAQRFEQAQLEVAHQAVGVAAEARKAYFAAVAAQELQAYQAQVQEAADAAGELARRMRAAGHFSQLAQLREQAFQADATAQGARARHQALAARERLARALGLDADQLQDKLPQRLPPLPGQPFEPQDAERQAMAQRLDVRLAQRAAASTAASLGLTRVTRVVNVFELGYQNRSTHGEPRATGYEIELELPLFDAGSTRLARAEASYLQSVHQVAEVALQARSEVREATSAYRTAHDLARHYRDEVVPLRKRISEENLLRYNGMLISVFELLTDAREQIGSVTASVEALRDFWLADADLQTALTGRSPGPLAAPTRTQPAAASNGH